MREFEIELATLSKVMVRLEKSIYITLFMAILFNVITLLVEKNYEMECGYPLFVILSVVSGVALLTGIIFTVYYSFRYILIVSIFLDYQFFETVKSTFRMRKIMRKMVENDSKITNQYNQSIGKLFTQVTGEFVFLFIPIPKSYEANEILINNLQTIREELSNYYGSYNFESNNRTKNYYYIFGSKR